MEISKLQDSISILITLQSMVDECLAIIKTERRDKKSVVHALVSSQLLIYVNSFLEEWENLGSVCKGDNRVMKVRKIASPFTRRLRSWDLIGIRNAFLAHNFRDKGVNVLTKSHDSELNTPSTYGDNVLLCGCIFCIKEILVTEFKSEYNELIAHLKTVKAPEVKKGIENDKLAMKELNQLIEQSDSLRQDYIK